MAIFELEKIEWVNGKIDFYHLVIKGRNQFLDYEKKLKAEGMYNSELITLQARIQEMSELKLLPETKCRNITPDKENVKEYELKTRNLRLYLFHLELKGRVIVYLSKKTPKGQRKDINRFRLIKNSFLKSFYA